MRRHHFVAIAVGIAVGLLLWMWPRSAPIDETPSQVKSPAEIEKAKERRAGARYGAGGRSDEELASARKKRAELEQKLRAIESERTRAGNTNVAEPVPTGKIDADYVRGRMSDMLPMIKECYELALREDPKLGGKLVVNFEIVGEKGVGGLVESAEIARTGAPDAGEAAHPVLDECLRATIESISFPPPEGGGRIKVTYPFVFATDEK